jgi:hypothetical protein
LTRDVVQGALLAEREVGALREVLPKQPVGVLVAGPLPGAARFAEVVLNAGIKAQLQALIASLRYDPPVAPSPQASGASATPDATR